MDARDHARCLISLIALLACLAGLAASCGGGDDGGGAVDGDADGDTDTDADSDGDTDTDADTDTDTDGDWDCGGGLVEVCPAPAWGTDITVGSPVANWQMHGYADLDLDGVIEDAEKTETYFSMYGLYCCAGLRSLVVLFGTTTCPNCPAYFAELSGRAGELEAANSAILAVITAGSTPIATGDAYAYLSEYFDGSYFLGTPPNITFSGGTPYAIVIDMDDALVLYSQGTAFFPYDIQGVIDAVNLAASN
jgi:hypothetical protein